jgi:hypothetical protein
MENQENQTPKEISFNVFKKLEEDIHKKSEDSVYQGLMESRRVNSLAACLVSIFSKHDSFSLTKFGLNAWRVMNKGNEKIADLILFPDMVCIDTQFVSCYSFRGKLKLDERGFVDLEFLWDLLNCMGIKI